MSTLYEVYFFRVENVAVDTNGISIEYISSSYFLQCFQ